MILSELLTPEELERFNNMSDKEKNEIYEKITYQVLANGDVKQAIEDEVKPLVK